MESFKNVLEDFNQITELDFQGEYKIQQKIDELNRINQGRK